MLNYSHEGPWYNCTLGSHIILNYIWKLKVEEERGSRTLGLI